MSETKRTFINQQKKVFGMTFKVAAWMNEDSWDRSSQSMLLLMATWQDKRRQLGCKTATCDVSNNRPIEREYAELRSDAEGGTNFKTYEKQKAGGRHTQAKSSFGNRSQLNENIRVILSNTGQRLDTGIVHLTRTRTLYNVIYTRQETTINTETKTNNSINAVCQQHVLMMPSRLYKPSTSDAFQFWSDTILWHVTTLRTKKRKRNSYLQTKYS